MLLSRGYCHVSPRLESPKNMSFSTPIPESLNLGKDKPDTDKTTANEIRILVAEDNPVNQRVVTLLLERIGYSCKIASNGLEALELLMHEPYDILLLDVQMPVMDGMETARRIRDHFPPESRPWIIALTAHAMQGDREDCLTAGMDDYLTKPINSDALKAALQRGIKSRSSLALP
jgi:CheY-like chemotaxis protein